MPFELSENVNIMEVCQSISAKGVNGADAFANYPVGIFDDDQRWFYVPAGWKGCFAVTFAGNATGSWSLNYQYCLGFDATNVAEYSSSSSITATTSLVFGTNWFNKGGWWRPMSITSNALGAYSAVTLMRVGIITNGTFDAPTALSSSQTWLEPITYATELASSTMPYRSTRATAAAVLMSNVGKMLQMEGTVNAARIPIADQDNILAPAFYDSLISSQAPPVRYYGKLAKGLYTFTIPDGSTDHFKNYVDTHATIVDLFHLDSFQYANVAILSDLSGDEGSTLSYTVDRHLEFRTTSQLFPTKVSAMTLEHYHQSQLALVSLLPFYENPLHLGQIASLAMQAARSLAPIVAPHATRAARAVMAYVAPKALAYLGTKTKPKPRAKPPKPAPKPKKTRNRPKRR
jgi:hypothetical protein